MIELGKGTRLEHTAAPRNLFSTYSLLINVILRHARTHARLLGDEVEAARNVHT